MKGIILAGGKGSRLYPMTIPISKQLLPIYDKPMIYYPLSTLVLAGIKDILIISMPEELPRFKKLLKDGSQWGLSIQYIEQCIPKGLADAFILGETFIGKSSVCLILGDNIFYGQNLKQILSEAAQLNTGALIFGYYVKNPNQYGVIEFDESWQVVSLIEKPKSAKSNYAATGLYFYDNQVVEHAKSLSPSARGELEITDLNNIYLNQNQLKVQLMGRGMTWLDMGTPQALIDAALYVKTIEERQGLKIACIEEIAFRMGLINSDQLKNLADKHHYSEYSQYLYQLLKQ